MGYFVIVKIYSNKVNMIQRNFPGKGMGMYNLFDKEDVVVFANSYNYHFINCFNSKRGQGNIFIKIPFGRHHIQI